MHIHSTHLVFLLFVVSMIALSVLSGCNNANVNYGVGMHGGSGGWGSSFSVGISNHHYRRRR